MTDRLLMAVYDRHGQLVTFRPTELDLRPTDVSNELGALEWDFLEWSHFRVMVRMWSADRERRR